MSKAMERPVEESPAEKAPQRFYCPALDGLRTLAFFMVFFTHAVPYTLLGTYIHSPALDDAWGALVRMGAYGVPLFFALSSFLITRLLLLEKEQFGSVHVGNFYLRRILRIWPLYFLILVSALALNPLINHPNPIGLQSYEPITGWMIFRFATFSANFALAGLAAAPLSIGILWSVCVEEQFYLCWPLVLRWTPNVRTLAAVSITMVIVGTASRLYLASPGTTDWRVVWNNTLCHLDCFGFGSLAAMLHAKRSFSIPRRYGMLITLASILGIYLIVKAWPMTVIDHPLTIPSVLGYTGIAFLAALIVLNTAAQTGTIFASRPMVGIGKITYGLYCFHALAIALIVAFWPRPHFAEFIVVRLLVTFALAYASFKLFEEPILKLKSRFQFVKSGAALG